MAVTVRTLYVSERSLYSIALRPRSFNSNARKLDSSDSAGSGLFET